MKCSLKETVRILRQNPDEDIALKFPLEAGMLMRRTVHNWVSYAQKKGLEVQEFENWGLLESAFRIDIKGKAGIIADALLALPVES